MSPDAGRFYRVRVHGTSYLMRMEDGEIRILGFHANRWVAAENEQEAGRTAIEMIRADRRMQDQVEVRLVAEEIEQVAADGAENNRSGFMFYDADSDPN